MDDARVAGAGPREAVSARTVVGVFDSGLGGLSVLRELVTILPSARFVYVADSGYVPYGTRPPAFIRERSLAIARYLIDTHAAAVVVVACNTATTHAVETLRATFDVPIVGMEPAIKPASAATRSGVVGVLATESTLGGERFTTLAERYADGVEILTQPCPGLVERVETGEVNGTETARLLREYALPLVERGADTLVLGCTHYPFLRATLQAIVGPGVTLIDTGAAVARQTARVLGLAPSESPGSASSIDVFTSGGVDVARCVVPQLLGAPVRRVAPLPAAVRH